MFVVAYNFQGGTFLRTYTSAITVSARYLVRDDMFTDQ